MISEYNKLFNNFLILLVVSNIILSTFFVYLIYHTNNENYSIDIELQEQILEQFNQIQNNQLELQIVASDILILQNQIRNNNQRIQELNSSQITQSRVVGEIAYELDKSIQKLDKNIEDTNRLYGKNTKYGEKKVGDAYGQYYPDSKEIITYGSKWTSLQLYELQYVQNHELAHYIWYTYIPDEDRKEWTKLYEKYGSITEYGNTSAEEDYAESFAKSFVCSYNFDVLANKEKQDLILKTISN